MDKDLIQSKLEALTRCIVRIRERTPNSIEKLENDYDVQDIISINLERAIQNCVDIAAHICCDFSETPETMSDSFLIMYKNGILTKELADKMTKSVGFRNIAIHQYQSISWKVVYSICVNGIEDLIEFAKVIEKFVEEKWDANFNIF